MFGWLVIGGTCLSSSFAFVILYIFIREGIKDDLAYPIPHCDTDMAEECFEEKTR